MRVGIWNQANVYNKVIGAREVHLSFQIDHQRRQRWRVTMKKFLLATVGLVALGMAAPASGADVAAPPYTKAPPPPVVAIYDWTGLYIGVNGGCGPARKCWDLVGDSDADWPGPEGCHNATGGTAGGQIGYRW